MSQDIYDLLAYQKRFFADRSRFKIGLWSRQTGKSFTTALEAVDECVATLNALWICLSAGERQSLEWMQKAQEHAHKYHVAAEIEGLSLPHEPQRLQLRFPETKARIIGLPANPNTARGYSGNVILDEFAFHDHSRDIWRALVPTITRGYRLIVVSTANGQTNQFYDLWTNNPSFAKHKVSILDAHADGLKVNLAELQAAMDPDGWRQEYLCEFVDEASALLPYDLIAANESADCLAARLEDIDHHADLYLGMDIGRQHDLSVIWLAERIGDVYWTRLVRVLEKTPFHVQQEILHGYLADPRVRRACIDSTGIGAMLAEEARRLCGPRVEEVTFTAASKEEMAMGLLRGMQDRLVRLPADRVIREDLHSVRKLTTAAGNVRYQAERDAIGHADRFWALALALHAGARGAEIVIPPTVLPVSRGLDFWGKAV